MNERYLKIPIYYTGKLDIKKFFKYLNMNSKSLDLLRLEKINKYYLETNKKILYFKAYVFYFLVLI